MKSRQAHLQRISRFLLPGEGVWWEKTENGYHFFDGDEDLETHSEGPLLLHHRSVLLEEVGKQQRVAWKFILDHGIPLPTPRLYLYDEDGNPLQNQQPSGHQSTVHLYSTNDESTHRNPNSDKTIASHPTEDQIITSYPTDGHTTASYPTDDHTIASHPTDDDTIASHPTDDDTIASHPTDDHTIASHPTDDHTIASHPTDDHTIASHPTDDHTIASHPTDGHTIASHPTDDHTIASHPTDDQTIASQCSSHQTSRDSQNHSTESSHCLQENSDTDPILEFRDTSNSIQDGQTDTCYKTTYATQIAKVIGHAPDVATFDKLRSELKSKQLTSHEERTKHDKLLATLQKAILNKRSSLMKNITHKVRGPNSGRVLIRDTSNFSPFFQSLVSCSRTIFSTSTEYLLQQLRINFRYDSSTYFIKIM